MPCADTRKVWLQITKSKKCVKSTMTRSRAQFNCSTSKWTTILTRFARPTWTRSSRRPNCSKPQTSPTWGRPASNPTGRLNCATPTCMRHSLKSLALWRKSLQSAQSSTPILMPRAAHRGASWFRLRRCASPNNTNGCSKKRLSSRCCRSSIS